MLITVKKTEWPEECKTGEEEEDEMAKQENITTKEILICIGKWKWNLNSKRKVKIRELTDKIYSNIYISPNLVTRDKY